MGAGGPGRGGLRRRQAAGGGVAAMAAVGRAAGCAAGPDPPVAPARFAAGRRGGRARTFAGFNRGRPQPRPGAGGQGGRAGRRGVAARGAGVRDGHRRGAGRPPPQLSLWRRPAAEGSARGGEPPSAQRRTGAVGPEGPGRTRPGAFRDGRTGRGGGPVRGGARTGSGRRPRPLRARRRSRTPGPHVRCVRAL